MMRAMVAAGLLLTAGQAGAEDARVIWQLERVNGVDFAARATLSIMADGSVQGEAPCNRYGGVLTAVPPDWAMGPVRATKMACDALAAEQVFFDALGRMTGAEMTGDTLVLTGPDGATMVFSAARM